MLRGGTSSQTRTPTFRIPLQITTLKSTNNYGLLVLNADTLFFARTNVVFVLIIIGTWITPVEAEVHVCTPLPVMELRYV